MTQIGGAASHTVGPASPSRRLFDASRASWLRRYAVSVLIVDVIALLTAGVCGVFLRFGDDDSVRVRGVPYLVASLLLVPLWLSVMALGRAYERRFLGSGSEEFKRVATSSFRLVGVVVFLAYVTKTDVARGYLAIVAPMGMGLLIAGRLGGRMALHRARIRGECCHRVVVVGSQETALEMAEKVRREPLAGLEIVAACIAGSSQPVLGPNCPVPVLGALTDVVAVLERVGGDTVAVAAGPGITSEELRKLSYELEGTGVDLLVAPTLTNVTGTRVSVRPIAGLPLLHVDEPELTGARRLVKGLFDFFVGLALLVLVTPLLVGLATAIRLTSRGPAFFRQQRVGKDGKHFTIWKLRTMYSDAEAKRAEIEALNVHQSGVLFKIHADPRITVVGRLLRRYSLDELPQLLNVVLGHMSLVGPRPPLQSEVDLYEAYTHRRLLVKPGITGLWQVSGRSDLSWEDTVRLDLQYVENWSLGLDVAVLVKTVLAILRPRGAY